MAALGLHLLLGLSLAETSGGCPLVVEHGLTCPAGCGIFPGRGSNLCLLWWPAEAYPLSHLGNLVAFFVCFFLNWLCQVLVATCRI